ncbi:MAG: 1-deoxy-D-xylulose-5-phosphate synthase [Bacteroidetes bacterium]|nr:1-deoxy-D-xylulose-5-phosphate synthase [Bacteroidota bacterium]
MAAKFELLSDIEFPEDLKKLNLNQLPQLCTEIRNFIIENVLQNGGHFAANLGVVELTVALHFVYNAPYDKIVWDVGHQAYIHKILTGRKKVFYTNRKLGGISGFPNIFESPYDSFGTGHSSTSVSAVLGMAVAAKLLNETNKKHIAIVGDGALTGGQLFEGLNNLAVSETNTLLILNDNNIGIDKNTGTVNNHLSNINPLNNIFTNLGLHYTGIVDGHDVFELISSFKMLKDIEKPGVLHIKTTKGKGHPEAEKEQTLWHSTSKYIKIENPQKQKLNNKLKYQDVFGKTLLELARSNSKICGVTPAMPTGCGMIEAMNEYPNRFFDVGIAEQHAVTFSAGLAIEGFKVFCSLYSTFAQRAYDQIIHDVCLQNLPVIFCFDRAGNAADDGATHHGMYDIAMLLPLPNITIATPSNATDLRNMLHYFSKNAKGPIAIRYPKGLIPDVDFNFNNKVGINLPSGIIKQNEGKEVAIIAVGTMLEICKNAVKILASKSINATLYSMIIVKPFDETNIIKILAQNKFVITVEDGCKTNGAGSLIKQVKSDNNFLCKIINLGFPDEVIPHGSYFEIFEKYKLNAQSIADIVFENLG